MTFIVYYVKLIIINNVVGVYMLFFVVISELGNIWHKDHCKLYAFDSRYKRDKFYKTHENTFKFKERDIIRLFGADYKKYITNWIPSLNNYQ